MTAAMLLQHLQLVPMPNPFDLPHPGPAGELEGTALTHQYGPG